MYIFIKTYSEIEVEARIWRSMRGYMLSNDHTSLTTPCTRFCENSAHPHASADKTNDKSLPVEGPTE